MKIAMLTPSVSRAAGGIYEIERRLSQELATRPEVQVEVFACRDRLTEADLPAWVPLCPRVFPVRGPKAFGWAPGMASALAAWEPDLVHLHALWMYPSIVANRWRRRTGRPVLITANGMLDPWALRNSAWKKRLALRLFERRNLVGASCIQVNSRSELESIRALGLTQPVAVIPNGVDLPDLPAATCAPPNEPKRLLFLGRLHPKKGLANALRAWAAVQNTDAGKQALAGWQLVIAGWDQGGHEAELKRLCTELGLAWCDPSSPRHSALDSRPISFLGPVFGEAKETLLRACSAFILPSFSEGLPMAVLEAWSYGKPVLITPACNLPEGFNAGAAIRLTPDEEGVLRGLRELANLTPPALAAMGAAGRALVERQFTWPQVAQQLHEVCHWLVCGGERPKCVEK